jgi:hypothetical protein
MSGANQSWFDRVSRYASTRFRGNATLTLATAAFMLGLALVPKSFGVEPLPLVIVIGLPVAFWFAVVVHGSRVRRHGKSRSTSTRDRRSL